MSDLDRIRWHCRRGLLELDLVLTKFLDNRFDSLTEPQKQVFLQIINYSDNDLWNLVSGKSEACDPKVREIIKMLE
jgi:antitoxin CptB